MNDVPAAAGDPVCWMHRVCPDCGFFLEEPEAPCPRCGAVLRHDEESTDESGPGPLP
ncbi:hypothetical protein QLG13_10630 [Rhodococcus aetherivorans]|uniref:hypothetical protein n=1 Tax=Rhodococcus TaxID=1827 RepID=UPI0002D23AAD|nr:MULTISPECIES: hypothetical protein [Rhodococcus]MBC2590667.1 hypothetical protein [Rhodococcus aetherivorans]QIX49951.1 hypothetical protein HFP48_10540 [Rhodococcus sp. DMU1]WFS13694.1 hypothetical protein P9K37_00770 [Rhodococcus aetherivorans]CCW12929.1 hypothetical protein EBESD8_34820 [Rhodococcus aetherivorans]